MRGCARFAGAPELHEESGALDQEAGLAEAGVCGKCGLLCIIKPVAGGEEIDHFGRRYTVTVGEDAQGRQTRVEVVCRRGYHFHHCLVFWPHLARFDQHIEPGRTIYAQVSQPHDTEDQLLVLSVIEDVQKCSPPGPQPLGVIFGHVVEQDGEFFVVAVRQAADQ